MAYLELVGFEYKPAGKAEKTAKTGDKKDSEAKVEEKAPAKKAPAKKAAEAKK